MQGGKNWILPKEINANRFFWDSHWLEIWSNHFVPLWNRMEGVWLWTHFKLRRAGFEKNGFLPHGFHSCSACTDRDIKPVFEQVVFILRMLRFLMHSVGCNIRFLSRVVHSAHAPVQHAQHADSEEISSFCQRSYGSQCD
jgi:hypothetical protein